MNRKDKNNDILCQLLELGSISGYGVKTLIAVYAPVNKNYPNNDKTESESVLDYYRNR